MKKSEECATKIFLWATRKESREYSYSVARSELNFVDRGAALREYFVKNATPIIEEYMKKAIGEIKNERTKDV